MGQGQRMKPFRLAALSLALLTTFTLVGCDNSDDKPQAAAPAASTATTPKAAEKPDADKLANLAAQSQGKALTLLDASEVQLWGNAKVERHYPNGKPPMVLEGEFLHAWPQLERLRSHLPVTLTRGGSRFTGNSLEYDNARQVALLQGRVRGHIEAPKRTR